MIIAILFIFTITDVTLAYDFRFIQLPAHHLQHLFFSNATLRSWCIEQGKDCPYLEQAEHPRCWGFEESCPIADVKAAQKLIKCQTPSRVPEFWGQGDFGYINRYSKPWIEYCQASPGKAVQSNIVCNDHLQFCMAKNIAFDFSKTELSKSRRWWDAGLMKEGSGAFSGNCKMNWPALKRQADRHDFLQSWTSEMTKFTEVDVNDPHENCDVTIDKTAFIVKLDWAPNMSHHFCDFTNIYVTQLMLAHFDKDIVIVNWHTSTASYKDKDPFHLTWQAFSWHEPIEISTWANKRVCFKQAIFPLLPRLWQGLFFNFYLAPGCERSSMMRSFHEFIIHRLNVTQDGPLTDGTIRINLLQRKSAHRRIMNSQQLIDAANARIQGVKVQEVSFEKVPFSDQLHTSHNTDVYVGLHGAGMTHTLFLPEWASLVELYHCEDERCYNVLARMRDVRYSTFDKKFIHPTGPGKHPSTGKPHPMFTDYNFDEDEFVRQLQAAADAVRQHPAYKTALSKKIESAKFDTKSEL